MPETVEIRVNGRSEDVPVGLSVAGLIERHGLSGSPCAAEVNETLVPKREHAGRVLVAGDRVELVTLVGGG